mmetsp:Transcript_38466/g.53400  ORF Transcript_38466/g.53400 Transcript_38466/m.53400 type:complete len:256 (+) Transcript_38466:75-842(+)
MSSTPLGASSSQARIAQLNQKFSSLQQGIEDERALRLAALEARLAQLSEQADDVMQHDQKINVDFWDHLSLVESETEEEKCARGLLSEGLSAELQHLDSRTQLGLEMEQQTRAAGEASVRSGLSVATESLRNELGQDSQATQDMQRRQAATMASEMPKLVKELGMERSSREATETRLVAHAQEEIVTLRMQIQREKKLREEMEEGMLQALETTLSALQAELGTEKQARMKVEETLFSLMEAVSAKFTELTSIAEA